MTNAEQIRVWNEVNAERWIRLRGQLTGEVASREAAFGARYLLADAQVQRFEEKFALCFSRFGLMFFEDPPTRRFCCRRARRPRQCAGRARLASACAPVSRQSCATPWREKPCAGSPGSPPPHVDTRRGIQ
jgi:hypothetical protein